MGWRDLLGKSSGPLVAPWLGGRVIHREGRAFRIAGPLPREFGWYLWQIRGRVVERMKGFDVSIPQSFWDERHFNRGYLVGDRFVSETARVDPDPEKLADQTAPIYLVEEGLDRFAFVEAAFLNEPAGMIYKQELFPLGPEDEVRRAFIDRKESINDIAGVVPALDLAFRFATRQRQLLEERRAELERIRQEEERRERAVRNMGTAAGRRELAAEDPEAAARAALRVSGAELLDVRNGRNRREMVVQFRFQNRRFECVAQKDTLRIVDSGICLTDHRSGEKGDTYFTLESLPGVILEAIQGGRLVVYRHVDDDYDFEED